MEPQKQSFAVEPVGQREATVLDDGRIKLPADVLRRLRSSKTRLHVLYPGRLPLAKALVLCPKPFWDRWTEALKLRFPVLKTHPGAAAYLSPFKPATLDRQGRMSLSAPASYHAGIRKGISIVLIGRGYYLELWAEEEFKKAFKDCEAALAQADLRQLNGKGLGEDCHIQTQGDGT